MNTHQFALKSRLIIKNRYISLYLFRMYKHYYLTKVKKRPYIEVMAFNHNDIKYQVITSKPNPQFLFEGEKVAIKKVDKNTYLISLPNRQGCLQIAKYKYQLKQYSRPQINRDSIILICDRREKADDNGQYLYEWIMANKQEYNNIYFAINKDSKHYLKLQAKGFKLINFDSSEFKYVYKRAAVIISSVGADYIENYHHLRYFKRAPKSRFICLQHGVSHSIQNKYALNQKIDAIIYSLELEKKNLVNEKSPYFCWQTHQLGMSRVKINNYQTANAVVYMPTWSEQLRDCTNITKTSYYLNIQKLTQDQKLATYLKLNKITMRIIIHPMLEHWHRQLACLSTNYIHILSSTNISYRQELERAMIFMTDTSSVFFDALWLGIPIIFYQLADNERFAIDELKAEIGVCCKNVEELTNQLEYLKTTNNGSSIPPQYQPPNINLTNERIWELIVDG